MLDLVEELIVKEEVEGTELSVEGIEFSEGEEVEIWLFFSISSFSLFMYVSSDFLPRSYLLKLFVICFGFLSIFVLSII